MTDSDKQSSKRGRLYIIAFSVFLILAASGLVSFLAMGEFERVLVPELDKKSYSLGTSVQGLIIKSVGYGIPVDKLNGVREYFDTILNENPELKYVALTNKVGEVLFTSSGFPLSLQATFFFFLLGIGQISAFLGATVLISQEAIEVLQKEGLRSVIGTRQTP